MDPLLRAFISHTNRYQVDPRTLIPVPAVALTTLIACLLALINIGSSTAFNDIISLAIVGLFSSYLIVCILFLWRRMSGHIKSYADTPEFVANVPGKQLVWGRWRLPKTFGILNNIFSIIYLIIILFFSFWPSTTPVTASTMNYSSLMLGAAIIFSIIYYFVWAKKVYEGPVVEVK